MTVIKTGRICLFASIFLLMAALLLPQTARCDVAEFSGRINIIFEDGSLMFYLGTGAGLAEGQEYDIYADGANIARIHLIKVDTYSSVATVLDSEGTIKEGMTYTFKAAVKGQKASSTRKVSSKEGSSRKRKTITKKEAPKDIARKSSRRRKAVKKSDEEVVVEDLKLKGEKEEEPKSEKRKTSKRRKKKTTEKRKTEKKKIAKKEDTSKGRTKVKRKGEGELPKMKQPRHGPRYLNNGVSRFGLTGLMLIPTADVINEDSARVGWGYQKYSASSRYAISGVPMEIHSERKINSYYFTYGLDENVEVSVVSRDTTGHDRLIVSGSSPEIQDPSMKSSEIGIKYSWPWSGEESKNATRGGIYLTWNDNRYDDNRKIRDIVYGLAGGVVLSDNAILHGTVGRDRIHYTGTGWESGYDSSDTNSFWGIGLEYKSTPFTSLFAEYLKTDVDTGSTDYDYDITETSIGVRHRPNEDVLLDLAYISHDENMSTSYASISLDDNYYMLRLNYLL